MKYFTALSVSCRVLDFVIIGIKERRFNSSPIHTYNQFGLEIAINVPSVRVDVKRVVDGRSIEL